VLTVDAGGTVRYVNKAASRLLHRRQSAAAGRPLKDLLTLVNAVDDTPVELPGMAQVLKRSAPLVFAPVHHAGGRGTPPALAVEIHALRGGPSREPGALVVLRDIGKQLDRERARVENEKTEIVRHMAAAVGHEFINWLTSISGQASTILDTVIPRTRAHEAARSILDITRKASGLTRRLQSLAHACEPEALHPLQDVDLNAVLASTVSQARAVFSDVDVEFVVKPPAAPVMVKADAEQLGDCLMNLFRNAVEAMPEGGNVTVDVTDGPSKYPDRVVLRVRDQGAGMNPETAARAFDPFFSTKDPDKGIGLGLTQVKHAVSRWGGTVRLHSRKGSGCSFRLFLQRGAATESVAREAGADSPVPILVMDDQPGHLHSLQKLLESAGYLAYAADTMDACLQRYHEHADELGLIILDAVTPNHDGKRALERLLALDPRAPLLVMSGFSRDYVRGYLQRGRWTFVQKPIEPETFLSLVARTISKHSGRRETRSA
jgi:signal transduction histidine kinase